MTEKMGKMTENPDAEVAAFLQQAFEDNYERLRVESGRGLSPDGKQFAWNQVLLYWRKLREVAQSITDTEVHLTLPNQKTPKGRRYAIEGVVDIVREKGYTVMYDIKSHDADYVRQNKALYAEQLNVYAHIWQTLRGEDLDETAIIATDFPPKVAEALESGDEGHLAYALAQWNPIIPLDYDTSRVDETVAEFGQVVDAIEDSRFAPPTVKHLDRREGATQQRFATAVCRNCDARFSCGSYRQWALGSTSRVEQAVRQYFGDVGRDEDLDSWRTANLGVTPDAADLTADYR
jgi:hypothetical protein